MKKNEILIIGSGFAGAVIAREFADKTNLKINIIEKRKSVGGNMYDEYDDNGFLIQKYGPHIIFTDDYSVLKYLSRFCDLIPHDCKMLSFIDGKFVHLPYGFKTIQELYSLEESYLIINELRKEYPNDKSVSIFNLLKSGNTVISKFGRELFEKGFKPYIAKQWNKTIDEIDESVVNRVQFQLTYVERYLQKDFQFLPEKGFTSLIKNMIKDQSISIHLNTDALEHISFVDDKILYDGDEYLYVFFTGGIDELFNNCYGSLPYRSILFKTEYFDKKQVLPCEICSYPSIGEYTRKTEYKYFSPLVKQGNKTVVVTETPIDYDCDAAEGNVQCYPVISDANIYIYNKYFELSKKYRNLCLIGRLAQYKYYNMDAVINESLKLSKDIIDKLNGKS